MTMVRSLKLFLNLFMGTLMLAGCKEDPVTPAHKCQVLVVLDKTSSVSYAKSLPRIQKELTSRFAQTYASASKDIQSSLLVITSDTKVFPVPNRFGTDKPKDDDGSRGSQQAIQHWNTEKRKWLLNRVDEIVALIDSPCTSNTTDVFSIFNGIEQVQKNDGPWDSINVVVFSDMVNTCRPINMVKDIDITNARAKGESVCGDFMKQRRISGEGNDNLYLTIYTPDDMKNTAEVNQFWAGFFEQMGLKPTHYRFE
jgi:hypothetical protein